MKFLVFYVVDQIVSFYFQKYDNRITEFKSPKALTLPLATTSKIQSTLSAKPSSSTSSYQLDLFTPKSDISTPDVNRVGQSIFYDCIDLSPQITASGSRGGTEKQDDMKPEKSDTDEESKAFSITGKSI